MWRSSWSLKCAVVNQVNDLFKGADIDQAAGGAVTAVFGFYRVGVDSVTKEAVVECGAAIFKVESKRQKVRSFG